ncbi:MAG: hypothetical protein WB783_04490 [Arenicellales bacterium]
MRTQSFLKGLLLPIGGTLLSFMLVPSAHAVPSFARQTGQTCAACHTAFPQLTAFGRQFKLRAYTLSSARQVKSKNLDIGLWAPLSMMIQTNWNTLDKAPDPSTDNSKFLLPSQLSIFYAGSITNKSGAFVQVTAESGQGFSQDNTDIRIANSGSMGIYGLSLNNNPTVQDPWNSTLAWGFPWFEAGYGYEYPHSVMGALGGAVAGLTAYGFWNNHIYTELGAYSAVNSVGKDGPSTDGGKAIKGAAPYWRLAYAQDSGSTNWEVGTFGMYVKVPTAGFSSGQDKMTDTALDGQFQWTMDPNNSMTLDGYYLHEHQALDATSPGASGQHLDVIKADLTWYTHQKFGFTLGYRGAKSSSGAVSSSDDITEGFADPGNQDSDAFQVQLDYTPFLNTRFAVQYTDYAKLNGTTTGASDHNQLMLGAWFLF